MTLTPLALGLFVFTLISSAHAGCLPNRENEITCGDKRICVSGQKPAREGFFDPNKCLIHKKVCSTLSKLADVYIGGSKDQEPEEGKGHIEIASAHRIPVANRKICSSLGIPGAWCKSNAQRQGAPGSTHETCNAADFYVPGMPIGNKESAKSVKEKKQRLANELATAHGSTGINVYHTGRAHVSTSKKECFYTKGGVKPTVPSCYDHKRGKRKRRA